MSLVADYSDTSSSSCESNSDTESEDVQNADISSKKKPLLPSAGTLLKSEVSAGEVFQTKYHKEEQAKKKLERHVKMVENDEHLTIKNGRKICWNFRRGRCRFGTKCQYAHDSDLLTETPAESSKQQKNLVKQAATTKPNEGNYNIQKNKVEKNESLKRKKPGLGDSLTPGKRVMKSYKQTK